MADPTPSPTSTTEAPGTPRWVKVLAIVAVALIALVVVLLLVGGNHGPGRHLESNGGAGHSPPAGGHGP
jgi:hypothetical protein